MYGGSGFGNILKRLNTNGVPNSFSATFSWNAPLLHNIICTFFSCVYRKLRRMSSHFFGACSFFGWIMWLHFSCDTLRSSYDLDSYIYSFYIAFVMCLTGDLWRCHRKLQRKRSAIRKRWRSIELILIWKWWSGANTVLICCMKMILCLFFDTLCRIEAVERKNNREWEEDWGTEARPRSPKSPHSRKSPSPVPPEEKNTLTSKTKSSRKDTWKNLTELLLALFFMHALCVFSLPVTSVCCAGFLYGLSSKLL